MRLLELDSYNMENDRTFLKSIEEHVKDPYIRERLINRLEWYMVMANRCQCFYYMSACMGIVMPTPVSYTHLDVYKRQDVKGWNSVNKNAMTRMLARGKTDKTRLLMMVLDLLVSIRSSFRLAGFPVSIIGYKVSP